jgi:hypothetical protein
MVFELLGFASGVLTIGLAWALLLRYERFKVIDGLASGTRRQARAGNALIWPSR